MDLEDAGDRDEVVDPDVHPAVEHPLQRSVPDAEIVLQVAVGPASGRHRLPQDGAKLAQIIPGAWVPGVAWEKAAKETGEPAWKTPHFGRSRYTAGMENSRIDSEVRRLAELQE